MMNVTIVDHVAFVAFWLGFSRWLAILMQLPLFDNTAVPGIVKVLASFVIAWAFHPLVAPAIITEVQTVGVQYLWLLTAVHVGCGLVIGFFVKSFMALFSSAGTILTQQIGFASVSYFDPTQAQQTGPFEKIIQWTLIVLILTSGALVPMLKGVTESFYTVNSLNLEKMATSHVFFGEVYLGDHVGGSIIIRQHSYESGFWNCLSNCSADERFDGFVCGEYRLGIDSVYCYFR